MAELHLFPAWKIAVVLFVAILLAMELGFWAARKQKHPAEDSSAALKAVKGTLLALVGLLLGFTFSMAQGRYETRKHLLIQEANAIGTAYLRGDLMSEGRQGPYRELLKKYTDARIKFFRTTTVGELIPEALKTSEALQAEIWKLAIEQARENPQEVSNILLITSLNEMFDTGTERMAARQNEVPESILLLLLFSTLVVGFFVGHSFGIGKERSWLAALGFALVITLVMYVILTLDQPRRGMIRISQEVMVHLRSSMIE